MQSISILRTLIPSRCLITASRSTPRTLATLSASSRPISSWLPRPSPSRRRFNSSLVVPDSDAANAPPKPAEPSYQLTFTCKPCKHRSAHVITKHGYHKGTVLIKCPSCSSRHIISDHLKIFLDQKSTLEDILSKQGDLSNLLKKGKLGMRKGEIVGREGDEDMEFWDDGTQSEHKPAHPPSEPASGTNAPSS